RLAVLRRSASSTTSRSGDCRTTAAFGSPYHVARAARPSTVPHTLLTACSTLRGVLVTPGVYSTVRHGPLSRAGVARWRYGAGPPIRDSSWLQWEYCRAETVLPTPGSP